MSVAEFDADAVIDARDCILGRVASEVAQRALDGERIAIVNAEDAVITGDKEDVFETYRTRLQMGSDSGPYYPRRPDTIFKRSVRGMLPYKKPRGREALDGVRVYVGNPYEGDRDAEIVEDTSLDRLSNIRFVHLGEVSEQIGANVTW
ncbi:50S ribosomal protein L13 [Natrarchaeobius halalkaliphilus]|uniref:Large ribosomal subunit protein uL13 n=1 Tax=Natrarchaeobius halalkaliphilus TaxID=1679091 RepID=A0A3N6M596_9EURY|nr:50S ribosomal protein L13 [Natrarchaeobius halalkaliphilus]RQG91190.1 50S ribosomal protein L13 [Natrarchaeobius halalkaliphilus]